MDDLPALQAAGTGFRPATFRPADPLQSSGLGHLPTCTEPSRLPNYVLTGFTFGFRIGDNHKAVHFRASGHNLQSVRENPQLVEQYIQEEVRSWSSYLLDPILLFLYNTSSFLNLVTGKSLQIYQSLLVQGFMLPSIPACYPFAMPSLDDWTLIMQKLGKYP